MNSRIKKYDYLRSVSCFFIVLLHVSGSYWGLAEGWVAMTVYNALSRFAVPVFMMLGGGIYVGAG